MTFLHCTSIFYFSQSEEREVDTLWLSHGGVQNTFWDGGVQNTFWDSTIVPPRPKTCFGLHHRSTSAEENSVI